MNKGKSAAKALDKVGKEYGVLFVMYYHGVIDKRSYFRCKCNRCSNESDVRMDHLSRNPKSCHYCVNSLQKEISLKKYPEEFKKLNLKFQSYKGNAKTKNRNFEFTKEQFIKLLNSNCYYCNKEKCMGVDRVDNSKSYTIENSIPCCDICNQMKHIFSKDIFLSQITKIYEHKLKQSSTTIPLGSTL